LIVTALAVRLPTSNGVSSMVSSMSGLRRPGGPLESGVAEAYAGSSRSNAVRMLNVAALWSSRRRESGGQSGAISLVRLEGLVGGIPLSDASVISCSLRFPQKFAFILMATTMKER
jgi:hypothetical protein